MPQEPQPNWQPISTLPMIATVIDGMLADSETQHQTLLQAKDRPYVLDDATVARVFEAFEVQRDDLWLFDEQLSRWQQEPLKKDQQQEVERLTRQMGRLREVNAAILSLTEELQDKTIDRIMEKDDIEVGLDFLSGKLRL